MIENVMKGAAWLDEHHPGWVEKIDLPSLNMYSCSRCIVGQLLGDYAMGFNEWGDKHHSTKEGPAKWMEDKGFFLPYLSLTDKLATSKRWGELDEVWSRVIKERRGISCLKK